MQTKDYRLKTKDLRKISFKFVIFVLPLIFSLGCATVEEGARGILGISTKILEEGRKDAIKETFNYGYQDCYAKAKDILLIDKAYIYAEDKKQNLIAFYLSGAEASAELRDTTPVGLFFTSLDATHTQIEVSSPSTFAKEIIASKVFSRLIIELSAEAKKANRQKDVPAP